MNQSVTRHWQTRLVLDEVELAGIVHDDLADLLHCDPAAPPLEILEAKQALADDNALTTRLAASVQHLANAEGRSWSGRLHVEIQRWCGGYDLPATASPSDYITWCVLAGTPPTHEQSGAIAVADPRAGCSMVAMPGLPWGRPTMIAAKAGAHLAVPGWLTHYVIPVEKTQSVIVAVAFSL